MESNELLQAIYNDLQGVKQDISGLKEDVSGLKQDVSGLKQGQVALQEDVSGLKQDVSGLKQGQTSLQEDVSGLKQDVFEVKERTTRIEVTLENDIKKSVQLIAEGHAGIVDKIHDLDSIKTTVEDTKDEVDVVFKVMQGHSAEIKALKLLK